MLTSSFLYLVFPLGITSLHKGAQVNHSNYASVLYYQEESFGYQTPFRMYKFASYYFDDSGFGMLHALDAVK